MRSVASVAVALALLPHAASFAVSRGTHVRMMAPTDWSEAKSEISVAGSAATEKEDVQGVVVPTAAAAPAEDPVAFVFSKLFPGGSNRQIYFGVLQKPVDLATVPSAERAQLREQAAKDLTNIGADERQRRLYAGGAFSVFTAALATYLLASHAAPLTRVAIAPPLFLSYGYIASWKQGLWNIGQGGVWDVDGSGLQKIEDASLAAQLRAKVNAFNLQSAKVVGVAVLLFVVLPELF